MVVISDPLVEAAVHGYADYAEPPPKPLAVLAQLRHHRGHPQRRRVSRTGRDDWLGGPPTGSAAGIRRPVTTLGQRAPRPAPVVDPQVGLWVLIAGAGHG